MGWHYPNTVGNRSELIEKLTQPRNGGRTVALRRCCVGNVLWTVWNDPAGRFITCDLMVVHGGDWGYKPLCEEMHPYYYSCPLSYLELAPVACEEWRAGVREYHAWQREKRQQRKAQRSGR